MTRINITVPDGLLEKIDRTAASLGESRSGFLQEASARYIAEVEEERERERRRRDIDEAAERARQVGAKIPARYDGVDRIRRDRERDSK